MKPFTTMMGGETGKEGGGEGGDQREKTKRKGVEDKAKGGGSNGKGQDE